MRPVERSEIVDYQTYGDERSAFRTEVMKQKDDRRVHLGDYLTFLFENHDTVRYQIQEMIRVEQMVREAEILHEIETYNELIGGPGELGCSLLIEIDDPDERDRLLTQWIDLPEHLYVALQNGEKAYAQFDPRQVGESRLSSVQYLKFDTKGEAPISIGTDHPELTTEVGLSKAQRDALAKDLAD
jgi:hypothetical protein